MLQRSRACDAFNTFQSLSHKAKDFNDFQLMESKSLELIRTEID